MTAPSINARDLLDEALARPAAERSAFLDSACAGDGTLRAEIEELLGAFEKAESFLETPPVAARSTAFFQPEQRMMGRQIGRYTIRRKIDEGGMGAVYEAMQDQPHRIVALKLMKQGIASRSALRRFEYESQILGRLRHPGIAQVYEAGMHEDDSGSPSGGGVPYFAMEYIPNAVSLTQYAVDKALGTRERLKLFMQVCDAVHHGHQKGIIHRDLKPGNILVDSSGRPKVIDFGVARATDSDMAVTTLQTDVGELIGTLQYMSPEQCAADPNDLDTRSDLYALGVVLYELLVGRTPYDLSRLAIHEAARMVREKPPTRPSSVNPILRGDVETIVLKALEKDRTRRYQSAAEFGEDINRYLNRQPILARRASVFYQLSMLVKRHKAAAAAVFTIVAAMITAIVAISISHNRTATALHEIQVSNLCVRNFMTEIDENHGTFVLDRLRPDEHRGQPGRTVLCLPQPGKAQKTRLVFLADNGSVVKELVLPQPIPQWLAQKSEIYALGGAMLQDVLPENPGRELVVSLMGSAERYSLLAIYDLDLKPLRRMWGEGEFRSMSWDAKSGLLAIAMTAPNFARLVPQLASYDSAGCPESQHEPHLMFAIRPTNVQGVLAPLRGDAAHPPAHVEWAFACEMPVDIRDRQLGFGLRYAILPPDKDRSEAIGKLAMIRSFNPKEGRKDLWGWGHLDEEGKLLEPLEFERTLAADERWMENPEFVPIDLNHVSAAAAAAEPLMVLTGSFEETERLLRADQLLSSDSREAAIEVARAMSMNWRWLGDQAERMAKKEGAVEADFEMAAAIAHEGVRIHQERCPSPETCLAGWYSRNSLAVVQFKAGQYADSLQTFTECELIWAVCHNGNVRGNAFDIAYMAMAHHRLGHQYKARAELDRAIMILKEHPPPMIEMEQAAKVAIAEAQAMLESERPASSE